MNQRQPLGIWPPTAYSQADPAARAARPCRTPAEQAPGKATMADVCAAMGHSAIGVTDRVYVGTYPDDMADLAAVIDRVFPRGSITGQRS